MECFDIPYLHNIEDRRKSIALTGDFHLDCIVHHTITKYRVPIDEKIGYVSVALRYNTPTVLNELPERAMSIDESLRRIGQRGIN